MNKYEVVIFVGEGKNKEDKKKYKYLVPGFDMMDAEDTAILEHEKLGLEFNVETDIVDTEQIG